MASAFPSGQDSWATKSDNVDTVFAADVNNLQNAVAQLEIGGVAVKAISYAATITPNCPDGTLQAVTLTGNTTVANATNPLTGRTLILQFTQDVTGGRTVTWGAAYNTAWQPVGAPNAVSVISLWYDGAKWQAVAFNPPNVTAPNGTSANDSGPVAGIKISAPVNPWLYNLECGLWIVTSSGAIDKGRGIVIDNKNSKSDGLYIDAQAVGTAGGGVGIGIDVQDSTPTSNNSFGITISVKNTSAVGLFLDTPATAIGPTLAQFYTHATSASEMVRINALGNAAHIGLVIRNDGANAGMRAISVIDSSAVSRWNVNGQTGIVNITTAGATGSEVITDTGVNGANLKLSGDTGAGTPSKTIRASSGQFQVLNDGYSAAILTLTDAGTLRIPAAQAVDTIAGGALNIGTAVATSVVVGRAGQSLGFYGVAAVVKAGAITTPNAQTGSYVQADVTSLKTAIDAIRVALTNIGITA